MKTFEENIISRLQLLDREVERLRVGEKAIGGSGGVTDHGALTGLEDDDHPQYLLTTGKAADSDKLDGIDSTGFATATHSHDHGALTGLGDNDHPQYLLTTAKAADSDKLDGKDSTDFVKVSDLGVWTAYTPTWTAVTTNPAIGNGTLAGRYVVIGKLCTYVLGLVMGSTTTYGSGNWAFSLPKTAKNTTGINFFGLAHIRKVGTANYERIAQIAPKLSTTVINMFTDPTPGSNSQSISATVPFTWGDGDSLGIEITYEIE